MRDALREKARNPQESLEETIREVGEGRRADTPAHLITGVTLVIGAVFLVLVGIAFALYYLI